VDFGDDDQESDKTKETNKPIPAVKDDEQKKDVDKIIKEDKIRVAQTLNSDIDLPKGTVEIDAKDLIERGA